MIRRGSAKLKYEARYAWLIQRKALWRDVPGIHDDVTPANRGPLHALHRQMCAEGFISKNTSPETQRDTIRRLITELRGQRQHVGHWW